MNRLFVYDVQIFVGDIQVHDDFHIVGKVIKIYNQAHLLVFVLLLVELDDVVNFHFDDSFLRYRNFDGHTLADGAFYNLALENQTGLVVAERGLLHVKYSHYSLAINF